MPTTISPPQENPLFVADPMFAENPHDDVVGEHARKARNCESSDIVADTIPTPKSPATIDW